MKTSSLPLFVDIESDLQSMLDWTRFATTQMNQADLYFGHGTENAWDEAVVLVHVLHYLRISRKKHQMPFFNLG